MNKLLTLAIPTYNRAELLDKQLTWLAQAIIGIESDCEIFVSDNVQVTRLKRSLRSGKPTSVISH